MIDVHVFDVGHGACQLLRVPQGNGFCWILVDCCYRGEELKDSDLWHALEAKPKDEPLAVVMVTHYHSDHIRSITQVVEAFDCEVAAVVTPFPDTLLVLDAVGALAAAREPGATSASIHARKDRTRAEARRLLHKADGTARHYDAIGGMAPLAEASVQGLDIMALAPSNSDKSEARKMLKSQLEAAVGGKTPQGSSQVLQRIGAAYRVLHGGSRILFSGDREDWIWASDEKPAALLTVPHHGSADVVNEKAIACVCRCDAATVAVISADGQSHPSLVALSVYGSLAEVHCTRVSTHCADEMGRRPKPSRFGTGVGLLGSALQASDSDAADLTSEPCCGSMHFRIDGNKATMADDYVPTLWRCRGLAPLGATKRASVAP